MTMKNSIINVEKRWHAMPMSLVFDNRMNEGEKVLLFAMLNRSSQFKCTVTQSFYCKESWLSEKLNCTPRTIINRLNTLKKLGYITVKKVKEGSYYVNHYYINWEYINEYNNAFDINATPDGCGCEENDEDFNYGTNLEEYYEPEPAEEVPFEELKVEVINAAVEETEEEEKEVQTGVNINNVYLPKDSPITALIERLTGKEGNYFYYSWATYLDDKDGSYFASDTIRGCEFIKEELRPQLENFFVEYIRPQILKLYPNTKNYFKKFVI